jgi:RNA polymerase sigma-70 factor, ECF subfamily
MIEEREQADFRGRTVEPNATPSPWRALIEKIQSNDAAGMEELYGVFSRAVRFHLWHRIRPEDLEDTIHDTFLIVAAAIRRGHVREPSRLMAFVWGVVRRQLAQRYRSTANSLKYYVAVDGATEPRDQCPDPEWTAIKRQRQLLARQVLSEVVGRDREILIRFYLQEQTREEICREMDLTETQFRLLKSRAKERFGALGRRKVAG